MPSCARSSGSERVTQRFRPSGIWGAVLLPIDAHGCIDMGALADVVDRLCTAGLAGIYTNGTAGEFFNQTEAEFEAIVDLVASKAGAVSLPFQIGVSNTNPRIARARLERVRDCGASAVQVTLPDWWPPSAEEQICFLSGMAEAGQGMPLVLYNPPTAKVTLGIPEIAALAKAVPDLVGVKVAGGDEDWFAQRRTMLKELSVFTAGHRIAFARPLGSDGSYSNVACLSPWGAVRQWEMIASDPEAARDVERRFQSFMAEAVIPPAKSAGLSDAALDKMMAAAGGWGPIGPALLWPYYGATLQMVAHARESALRHVPDLMAAQ